MRKKEGPRVRPSLVRSKRHRDLSVEDSCGPKKISDVVSTWNFCNTIYSYVNSCAGAYPHSRNVFSGSSTRWEVSGLSSRQKDHSWYLQCMKVRHGLPESLYL